MRWKGGGRKTLVVSDPDLLDAQGFSLQANQKTLEGSSHPNRDAQLTCAWTRSRE